MTQVIGLAGKKRRGKDTVYASIQKQLDGETVVRDAFADRLKISFARLFLEPGSQAEPPFEGWTDEDCIAFTDHFKENGTLVLPEFPGGEMPDGVDVHSWNIEDVTGREALQKYGTEMHRDVFGSNFWVDQVLPGSGVGVRGRENVLAEKYPGADVLVITDVRFPNEAERVRAYGGVVFEVVRPALDAQDTDTHASETPLPRELVDAQIINDGTLADLDSRVLDALKETVWLTSP